jgi:UDP-N-acetylglucosamine 2-epimerase (non-hydrolysing)
MKKKKIFLIAGARPNFMKIAPLYHALIKEDWANSIIVHTGQHYDHNLSHTFFNDLGMPKPDVNLMIGSGSHAEQTAGIMIAFEKLVINEKPDIIIVVGDVNSTLACTITAKKCSIKVAHLEAGLRSFDMSMPEEINRIVTDALSDILWTPSPDADDILLKEGKAKKSIIRVGNIMIDSIRMMLPKIEQDNTFHSLGLQEKSYGVVTLHRPSNVDDKPTLDNICEALVSISEKYPLVFPLHPRTKKQLKQFDIYSKLENTKSIKLLEAMGYISFMSMIC